jgi:hypothetical protein
MRVPTTTSVMVKFGASPYFGWKKIYEKAITCVLEHEEQIRASFRDHDAFV